MKKIIQMSWQMTKFQNEYVVYFAILQKNKTITKLIRTFADFTKKNRHKCKRTRKITDVEIFF